jgi:glycosyltransferase involved in cell wall biosynthesis
MRVYRRRERKFLQRKSLVLDNTTQTEPINGMEAENNPQQQPRMAKGVPPEIFLMINSLETGGSERQFAALTRSLDLSSFSLHMGCIMEKGAFLEDLGPLFPFGLGGSLYSAKSFRSRIRLARHLRHHNIAIAHSFDFYTNLVLIPVAKLAGVPVVLGSQRQIGDLLTPPQSRAQTLVFRWCDKVVCNSQAAAERLRERGIAEDKLVVIRNGLPPSAFAGATPALPPVPGFLRVGMIARMNHRVKNHQGFLHAAARVAAKFSEVEFVLVGDGPFRAEIERETQNLGLANQVRFLGDRRDVPSVLASLDITVLPSSSESLSNSIIESMAAGVPVVANRVGGNTELISNDRGALVTAGDEAELAAAIESLLRNEGLRKSLGRNARAYAQANFTIERMRRSHEELYANLLERKGWRRKGHN